MKKIFVSIMLCITLLLASCSKTDVNEDGIKATTEYLSSLQSYGLNCDMTIHRTNKDITVNVDVDYLQPNYYKVCFNNKNGHEQIIVKNDDGVYVLTPSLNKEFKFDSQWPLNSSHAYLLGGICSDITNDEQATFTVNGDIVEIQSKLSGMNNNATKLKFYYNHKDNKPVKAILLDDSDKEQILVEFNEFTPNKSLKKEEFNPKLIMDNQSNNNESTTPEDSQTSWTITCGFICDGSTLSSSKIDDESTILCYTGEKSYTIVVKKADSYSTSVALETYDSMDFISTGLILSNANTSKYFIDDIEVAIYSNNLSSSDILAIASEITLS